MALSCSDGLPIGVILPPTTPDDDVDDDDEYVTASECSDTEEPSQLQNHTQRSIRDVATQTDSSIVTCIIS